MRRPRTAGLNHDTSEESNLAQRSHYDANDDDLEYLHPSTPSDNAANSAEDKKLEQQREAARRVNLPSVIDVGRHLDGDTDEIVFIACTQRSRRRSQGELPRCFTFGWRHVSKAELATASRPPYLPPKFLEEKELPAFWKERTIGTVENLTWEGDQTIDDDGDGLSGQPKAINVIGANKKREEWEEGSYLSFGRGTASTFEKVNNMNQSIGNYDAYRKFREEMWSMQRVATDIARQRAKILKKAGRDQERAAQTNAQVSSTTISTVNASTSSSQSQDSSTDQGMTSSLPSGSAGSSSGLKSHQAKVVEEQKSVARQQKGKEKAEEQLPPDSAQSPPDRRWSPAVIPRRPWYSQLFNYQPPPTGWTVDEDYGHRSYILPHPLRAAKENLIRSWSRVLTPTWKLTTMIKESFTSSSQSRFWRDMWKYTVSGGQADLLRTSHAMFKKKIEEIERKQKEEAEKAAAENGRSSSNSSGP